MLLRAIRIRQVKLAPKPRKKNSSQLCQNVQQSQLKLQKVFCKMCCKRQSYLKETVHYMNLTSIAAVQLQLIVELGNFCLRFLNIVFFILIFTYERYDIYFKAGTHSDKFSPGIINIYNPGQNIQNKVKKSSKT